MAAGPAAPTPLEGATTITASPSTPASVNRLLTALLALGGGDVTRFVAHLEPVELLHGAIIAVPGELLSHVYFPERAVLSVISRMHKGGAAEVGTVGNEGMAGVTVFLEAGPTPYEIVAQIPGMAHRLRAEIFAQEVLEQPALRRLFARYTQAFMTQVSQTAACNARHTIEQRCARWLLMTHDRVQGADDFPLTQEFLALMLGVRRAGVTVAVGALHARRLIRQRRGGIQVLDRRGLEAASCECYEVVREQFDRLLA